MNTEQVNPNIMPTLCSLKIPEVRDTCRIYCPHSQLIKTNYNKNKTINKYNKNELLVTKRLMFRWLILRNNVWLKTQGWMLMSIIIDNTQPLNQKSEGVSRTSFWQVLHCNKLALSHIVVLNRSLLINCSFKWTEFCSFRVHEQFLKNISIIMVNYRKTHSSGREWGFMVRLSVVVFQCLVSKILIDFSQGNK